LVYLPDEDTGVSTSFLDLCSGKEMVGAEGFRVLGEWGLDGEIVFISDVFFPVLIFR